MNNQIIQESICDNFNLYYYILDPLTVIIKLAIISNKPIGTKICIKNNIVYLQEPGIFQGVCRYFYKINKTELQYLYNPIEIACKTFLSPEYIKKTPRIKHLFLCAQKGIKNLIETYKTCSIIRLCLNYYYTIISNYIDEVYNVNIFHKDSISLLYTQNITDKLFSSWSEKKIEIILNLIDFLQVDNMGVTNVKSLENIIDNIDIENKSILDKIYDNSS